MSLDGKTLPARVDPSQIYTTNNTRKRGKNHGL